MSTTYLINVGDDQELVTVNDKRRLTAYIVELADPTRVSAEDALAAIDRGARRVDLREKPLPAGTPTREALVMPGEWL